MIFPWPRKEPGLEPQSSLPNPTQTRFLIVVARLILVFSYSSVISMNILHLSCCRYSEYKRNITYIF